MGTTRRDFLRRAGVAGAVAWTSPAIVTLPAGRAWADHYGPGVCDADATGLRVRLLDDPLVTLGHADRPGDGEVCGLRVGRISERADGSFTYRARSVLGLFRIAAEIACGQVFDAGGCRAHAQLADLVLEFGGPGHDNPDPDDDLGTIGLGLAGVDTNDHDGCCAPRQVIRIQAARADATADTDTDSTTGSSLVGKVTVVDEHGQSKHLNAVADCNFNLDVAGLVRVVLNEQVCRDGKLIVRAVRIDVPAATGGLVEVVAGEVRLRGPGTCAPCTM